MKIMEFQIRIHKIMKMLEFQMRIMKIMKILEFHMRTMKVMKDLKIPPENHDIHGNLINSTRELGK